MMIRQLFILLIMLAWSIALLATILPAFPVKDFTGVRKAATRSDDNRMGVIATLRYEKLSDMKMPYKLENLPYLGKIIFFHLHLRLYNSYHPHQQSIDLHFAYLLINSNTQSKAHWACQFVELKHS